VSERAARVWLGPESHPLLVQAIARGGGSLVESPEEANVVVWTGWPPDGMREVLHPGVEWVQLHLAGVERWFEQRLLDRDRVWTGAQGIYAPDVADHAVAFVLAAARRFPVAARRRSWAPLDGDRLPGRTVGIVGAGAIGRETIERLSPFGIRTIALTRSGHEVPGATRSLGVEELDELLRDSDYVVLAAPLTDATRGMIGERELQLIGSDGWLVNVARGGLVVTHELVTALAEGALAGACLDVTDPEPLPDGHPLWGFENVLVTPHVANPPGTIYEPLAGRVEENLRRFREGRELLAVVDPDLGY
jgi:phosphoglycerate dehydrogenase-like enzyme